MKIWVLFFISQFQIWKTQPVSAGLLQFAILLRPKPLNTPILSRCRFNEKS